MYRDKRILLVGLARSGMAAATVLHKRGAKLCAYDAKSRDKIAKEAGELEKMGIAVYAGEYPPMAALNLDMVVVSPGVPLDIAPIQDAYQIGISVIGELELAYRMKSDEVEMYAVTGTNGKTTTTALLHDILQKAGLITAAGGNIGVALCSLVDEMQSGVIAVEVSSFQLQTVEQFRPHICAVLNITPDHLDRHKTVEEYTRTKGNIFKKQNPDDFLILNYEDERVREFKNSARSKVVYFSVERVLEEGLFVENNTIWAAWNAKKEALVPLNEILLRGKHNLENILGAVAMAYMGGVSAEAIRQSLSTFKGVRHRLEEVAVHNGILYINDSKGTNPDSTIKALESFQQPIVLIAGGRAKGGDYSTVAGLIANRVKELVLVGEARELLKSAVMDYSYRNIHEVDDFASAVFKASELAEPGDVVLLSPACASWDMFESYEHRGDLFCELVEEIVRGNKHQG